MTLHKYVYILSIYVSELFLPKLSNGCVVEYLISTGQAGVQSWLLPSYFLNQKARRERERERDRERKEKKKK